MKSKQIRMITHGAILAALYVALTYLQNWLLPGTTSAAIQFRASEALCIFALFTPAAIPGLTVGCLLFNISNAGALPLDWLVGTGATLLATTCMYLLRRATLWRIPLPALLMPAVWMGDMILMRTLPGRQRVPFGSNRARAPVTATGTTGAPVLTAMRKAPALNSPAPPSSPL